MVSHDFLVVQEVDAWRVEADESDAVFMEVIDEARLQSGEILVEDLESIEGARGEQNSRLRRCPGEVVDRNPVTAAASHPHHFAPSPVEIDWLLIDTGLPGAVVAWSIGVSAEMNRRPQGRKVHGRAFGDPAEDFASGGVVPGPHLGDAGFDGRSDVDEHVMRIPQHSGFPVRFFFEAVFSLAGAR